MDVLIVCIVVLVVGVVLVSRLQRGIVQEAETSLTEEFPGAKIHVSTDDYSFLVIDFDQEKIAMGLHMPRGGILAREAPYKAVVAFSDLVKAEVLSDGTQVSSTNRGSQAVGAAVGAVALGGVGAIIGGLSGSSTTSSGTKRIALSITVDDQNRPVHEVTFFQTEMKKGGKRGQYMFDQGAKQVAAFAAHLEAAIRMSEKTVAAGVPASVPVSDGSTSVAGQIRELWSLKEAGALSVAEFEAQKASLIAS